MRVGMLQHADPGFSSVGQDQRVTNELFANSSSVTMTTEKSGGKPTSSNAVRSSLSAAI